MLEQKGYEVQVLEFIDMEHTPKNILIRAVKRQKKIQPAGRRGTPEQTEEKTGGQKGTVTEEELRRCMEALHVDPTLRRLLD